MTKLGSVISDIVDCEHKTAPLDDQGEYFAVGTPAMAGNVINYSQARRISRDTFVEWTRRLTPKVGDLLLAREAPVGPVVEMPAAENVAPGQRTVLMRPDSHVVDRKYLYYALSTPDTQTRLKEKAAGSTVAHLNVADIRSFEFPWVFPAVGVQQAIAEVLGALDDKIAANSGLSWAADRLASRLTQRALTSISPLGDVADLLMGTSPAGATMNEQGEGVAFFQGVRDFGIRAPKTRVFTVAPTKLAAPGDVLISVRAPVGSVNRADRDLCIGRGLAAARSQTPNTLFHAVRLATVWESFNGEGTVFGSINQSDLRRAQIPWTSESAVTSLERELTPIEARIDQAESESAQLSNLRDTLLPHLMSGRITVREAEKQVEEAL